MMNKWLFLAVIITALSLVQIACTCKSVQSPAFQSPGEQPSNQPQVSFTADKTSINPGECVYLQWNVSGKGFFEVKMDGQTVNASGQLNKCPPESTTYNLEVDLGTTMLRREVTVAVVGSNLPTTPGQSPQPSQQPSPGCPGAPVFTHFEALPNAITAGQTTTLDWGAITNGAGGTLVSSVVLTPGNFGEVGSPGSRRVSPTTTTTYTLTARGCGGTATKSVTVSVPLVGTPIPINPTAKAVISSLDVHFADVNNCSNNNRSCTYSPSVDVPCLISDKVDADITLSEPCTITYRWEYNGIAEPVKTVTFKQAGYLGLDSYRFSVGTSGKHTWRLNILSPISLMSDEVTLVVNCNK